MEDKTEQLLRLQAKIRQELEYPWFFPSKGDPSKGEKVVDGYLGTGPEMIVGQRPAAGGWKPGGKPPAPGHAAIVLDRFYDSLKRHGFEHAHLTDLVKEPKEVGGLTLEELDRNWKFFETEILIVDPVVIVALGNEVLGHLQQRLDRLVPLWRVTHYAYRYGKGQAVGQRFDRDIQRLAEVLKVT